MTRKLSILPKLFPVILILLTGIICFLNYTPKTFLTGWDTLHPEFNFSLNFKRLLSLWNSEQGLGAVPAHAQISDVPRVFILYLLHFILPLNFLRYSYVFLMFILGPLGIYFLINFLFKNYKSFFINLVSFLTALLYIFNLSTVQQFYVPFEMFPTQWAYLPFLIIFSLKYLELKKTRYLLIYSLLTILSSPQAYASQLWYAFFFIYSSFLVLYSLLQKESFKRSFKLITFTLLLNAFWLIPNIFYILSSSSAPLENRDNRLYSQEYLLRNRQNGVLTDSSLIRGFYLNWSIFDFSKNSFKNLMPQWQLHLKNPLVLTIGYSIFILSVFGLIIALKKKDKLFISLSPFFIIPFVLLSNKTFPFSYLFDFLIKNSTIRESFRFIFTKLSILQLFGLTIFFSYFLNFFYQKVKTFKPKLFIAIIITWSLIIYGFPIFRGNLISPAVKTNIPTSYFQFWQFMNQQTDGRVLVVPLNQSSGWQYYDWNYQGSGFLWFNLSQNLLDRDSDRWSNQNEQSYKEFFYSLYNQNIDSFTKTLEKYQIKYLVWDQSLISSSDKNNDQITFKYEIDDMLKQLQTKQSIKLVNQFENLIIYQTNFPYSKIKTETINNFVSPAYRWGFFDYATTPYVTIDKTSDYFPFRNILTKYQQFDLSKIKLDQRSDNQWYVTVNTHSLDIKIPSTYLSERVIPTAVYLKPINDKYQINFVYPLPTSASESLKNQFIVDSTTTEITINNQKFSFSLPLPQEIYLGQVNIFTQSPNYLNDELIDLNFSGQKSGHSREIEFISHSTNLYPHQTLSSLNKPDGFSADLYDLPHSFGYIVAIKSKYYSGIPLRLCLENSYSFLCAIEDQLSKNSDILWDYFLVPPTGNNFGYKLNIENISYGSTPSKSYLDQIAVIPIPFHLLSQSKIDHIETSPVKYVILDEAFNKNWLAYYFSGHKPVFLKNHVTANNWANAWALPSNPEFQNPNPPKIYVFFWPQLLIYLGIGITLTTLLFILKKSKS